MLKSVLSCSKCDAEVIAHTHTSAVRQALAAGWQVGNGWAGNTDVCPDCKALDKIEANAALATAAANWESHDDPIG